MSLIINQNQSEVYFGHLKLADDNIVSPGQVVLADFSAGTAAPPATDNGADGDALYLVANYDSYADTNLTNSKDFKVNAGGYLRLKALQTGDIITTDKVIGADVKVNDILAVNGTSASGDTGSWIAVGVRTPVLKAQVIEVTSIYGQTACKMIVL